MVWVGFVWNNFFSKPNSNQLALKKSQSNLARPQPNPTQPTHPPREHSWVSYWVPLLLWQWWLHKSYLSCDFARDDWFSLSISLKTGGSRFCNFQQWLLFLAKSCKRNLVDNYKIWLTILVDLDGIWKIWNQKIHNSSHTCPDAAIRMISLMVDKYVSVFFSRTDASPASMNLEDYASKCVGSSMVCNVSSSNTIVFCIFLIRMIPYTNWPIIHLGLHCFSCIIKKNLNNVRPWDTIEINMKL